MSDFIRFEDKSYGMIDVSRGSIGGKGKKLFGSDINHNNIISLTISQGAYDRGLNNDWFHGKEQLIRIELSPVQFAEAITNMNTSGVPCTITRFNGECINEVPDLINKKEVFREEFSKDIQEVSDIINRLSNEIEDLLNSKKAMNKSDKESIQKGLSRMKQQLNSNVPYLAKCFDEQIEKSVSHSKAEVEAYVQNKINTLGLKALKEEVGSLEIEESK